MKKIKFIVLCILSLIVVGCSHTKKAISGQNAGVFKTFDRGQTWQHKTFLPVPGGMRSIKDANIIKLRIDPQDNSAVYAATENRGLLYSFNGGEYWQQPTQLSTGKVNDIAIHPENKCTVYAAYGNKVVKTADCNRSWSDIYIDPRPKNVTSIVIDPQKPSFVYISTDFGEIIRSADGGNTWTTLNRFTKPAVQVAINSNNAEILYAAIENQAIYKSLDEGLSWTSVTESLKKTKGVFTNMMISLDDTQDDGIYLISKYGILRSDDGGANWEILNLLTPPSSTEIYSFAINPENGNHLYYGTSATLYRSQDRGLNWSVKKLPSTSVGSAVLVDPVNPSILYLGTKIIIPKKK